MGLRGFFIAIAFVYASNLHAFEFCARAAAFLSSAKPLSQNLTSIGIEMLKNPKGTATAHRAAYDTAVSSFNDLTGNWTQWTSEAPTMDFQQAAHLFYVIFDRVIYSDSFGAHLYWISKVEPSRLDISRLDTELEALVSALSIRLKDAPQDEASGIVTALATDFVVEGFSFARLSDRIAEIDEFLKIQNLGRKLTPAEMAQSKYVGFVREKETKKKQLAHLKEILEDESPADSSPSEASPATTVSTPAPSPSSPLPPAVRAVAPPDLPTTSLLDEIEGAHEIGNGDTRRAPVVSGNTGKDARKLPEHMQRAKDKADQKAANQLAAMNAMRLARGMKPLDTLSKPTRIRPE